MARLTGALVVVDFEQERAEDRRAPVGTCSLAASITFSQVAEPKLIKLTKSSRSFSKRSPLKSPSFLGHAPVEYAFSARRIFQEKSHYGLVVIAEDFEPWRTAIQERMSAPIGRNTIDDSSSSTPPVSKLFVRSELSPRDPSVWCRCSASSFKTKGCRKPNFYEKGCQCRCAK